MEFYKLLLLGTLHFALEICPCYFKKECEGRQLKFRITEAYFNLNGFLVECSHILKAIVLFKFRSDKLFVHSSYGHNYIILIKHAESF